MSEPSTDEDTVVCYCIANQQLLLLWKTNAPRLRHSGQKHLHISGINKPLHDKKKIKGMQC